MKKSNLVQGSETCSDNNSVFVKSDYSDRVIARRERFVDRAVKAQQQSNNQHERSRSLVRAIPFGQPILVGHHSERGHRNCISKSSAAMGKAVALANEAGRLASKADAVGRGGVASDDPDALGKLQSKLTKLEEFQEKMKAANKLVRKDDLSGLINLGISELEARELLTPDFANRKGYPSYRLQNNNAEIRRLKKRIEEIEEMHSSNPFEFDNEDFKIYIADGRVRVVFHLGKPTDEVCRMVGRVYGFKWSRFACEWVRKCTPSAIAIAPTLAEKLQALDSIY